MERETCKPARVLQVALGDGNFGGIASFLYSYYSHMNHNKVHFDFLYCGENSLSSKMCSPILKDSKITTLHIMKPNNNSVEEYQRLLKELNQFFDVNQYDIVHLNSANICFCACLAYVVRNRSKLIIHSHSTRMIGKRNNSPREMVKALLKLLCMKYLRKKADFFFACSYAAGEAVFGKSILNSPRFRIIENAIDVSNYRYNSETRSKIKPNGKLVIGHIGRISKEKNHTFLIDVFVEIHRYIPNCELWIVGDGALRETVETKVKSIGLKDCITLWGQRSDVADLMQAMDLILLPSLFEGLSIVSIEAQAVGLPIYASDSISPEHGLTDLIHFLPLSAGPQVWAQRIIEDVKNLPQRQDMSLVIAQKGYEINNAAKRLENFYGEMLALEDMDKSY